MHLGRNIINHGIEDPKMREEFGKDPVGKVTISTERMEVEGTPFWQLIIADDGAGIDTDALRSKLRRTLGEAAVDAMAQQPTH